MTWTDDVDQLFQVTAELAECKQAAEYLRSRVTAGALDRYAGEGATHWSRPGGKVTLVQPTPGWRTVDAGAFGRWLRARGYDNLVLATAEIADRYKIIDAFRLCDQAAELAGDVTRANELLAEAAALFHIGLCVWDEPLADAMGHLPEQVTRGLDGEAWTAAGELIPGVEWHDPPPTTVQIRPTQEAAGRAAGGS